MSEYPSTMLAIKRALELYGGWSRMFAMSRETWDKYNVVIRENQIGFWEEYAKALANEQFLKAVEEAVEAFREAYPQVKLPKQELRKKLADALVKEGWKPVKSHILAEIRRLRKEKRRIIQCLKTKRP